MASKNSPEVPPGDSPNYDRGEDWRGMLKVGARTTDQDVLHLLSVRCDNIAAAALKFTDLLGYLNKIKFDLTQSNRILFSFLESAALHDGAVYSMISIHYNLCMGTIASSGNDSTYVREMYNELKEGRAIGVFLATEIGYGNNLINLETRATYSPHNKCLILTSPGPESFKFMPNTVPTRLPKIAVVLAKLYIGNRNYGIYPFLLRITGAHTVNPGIKISALGHKPGLMLDNAITSFTEVAMPCDSLLSGGILTLSDDGGIIRHQQSRKIAFINAIRSINLGKMCMCVGSIAMAKSAVYLTHDYGSKRLTFGPSGSMPIGDYWSFKDAQITDVANLTIFSLWLHELQNLLPEYSRSLSSAEPFGDSLVNRLIIAKALISWSAQETLVRCRERCGAQGLFSENKIIDYFLTNNVMITAEGDNQVMMLKAARQLIDSPFAPPVLDHDVVELARPLISCLEKKCRALSTALSNASPGEAFSVLNEKGDDLITAAKMWGVIDAAASASRWSDESRILKAALKIFLSEWTSRLSIEILKEKASDANEMMAALDYRIQLIRAHGDDLLQLVKEFCIPENFVDTPISSENYIVWYAKHHLGNAI
jgi:acyl-CoA oxidase